ncbi:hypothetical protein D3C86_1557010 [compost metagenome]
MIEPIALVAAEDAGRLLVVMQAVEAVPGTAGIADYVNAVKFAIGDDLVVCLDALLAHSADELIESVGETDLFAEVIVHNHPSWKLRNSYSSCL